MAGNVVPVVRDSERSVPFSTRTRTSATKSRCKEVGRARLPTPCTALVNRDFAEACLLGYWTTPCKLARHFFCDCVRFSMSYRAADGGERVFGRRIYLLAAPARKGQPVHTAHRFASDQEHTHAKSVHA